MSLDNEFGNAICNHLAKHGWLYTEGDAPQFDPIRALFPADILGWVQETQSPAWEALEKFHGTQAEEILLSHLRHSLNSYGTLHVLRHGFELPGLRQPLQLAQFKPALTLNPDILAKYNANRLRIARQVRYSVDQKKCVGLLLLLNGLPVATVEHASDCTQSVEDAVDRYCFDHCPSFKNPLIEPLFSFPGGALVHFAVSPREVRVTTKLEGRATRFLPFNRGDNGAAGNPPNKQGHNTAYLWEEIWERESWLEILGRYLVVQKERRDQIQTILFPRYHQLDATRKLVAAVLSEGAGGKYLIQHSAGAGKTNTIAWTAHFLADLHDAQNKKVFDTVLVISDRNVIDAQLQEAIGSFERTVGVIAAIKNGKSGKSRQLLKALSDKKKIVVCTTQTLPFALKTVQELAAAQGKRFAVIVDEAHSSQTDEAAAKIKALLTVDEICTEDLLIDQIEANVNLNSITYIAFTSTPNSRTLDFFGRRLSPDLGAEENHPPLPFHLYSMQQAIDENFILDVLKNYTPYKLAFKLSHKDRETNHVEKSILHWVKLHPYNIAQKVRIVIEHFNQNVAPLLSGRAKAMVVVESREEVVRWQLAMDKYLKSQSYSIGTLAAFSGEVNLESESYSENDQRLNPHLHGRNISEAFDTDQYQILLVANKFQTGFDQPLLCGMYIDKKLNGVQAVQTMSRINRVYAGKYGVKETTYVLDFVNDENEILKSFKVYDKTAELGYFRDPDLLLNLRTKLDASGYYYDSEVNRAAAALLNSEAKQVELHATLKRVASRLLKCEREALTQFKRDMNTFQQAYLFLSQIFNYHRTAIEKRFIFFKQLLPLLEFGRAPRADDKRKLLLNEPDPKSMRDQEGISVEEIVAKLADIFNGELTDEDKLVYVNCVIKNKLLSSELLLQQAKNNSKEQFAHSPDLAHEIMHAIVEAFAAQSSMSKQALDSEKVRNSLRDALLGPAQLYESLREKGTAEINRFKKMGTINDR